MALGLLGSLSPVLLDAQNVAVESGFVAVGNGCGAVVTVKDAERCIGQGSRATRIPVLVAGHAYTLDELTDIAEEASPEGRIAWARAKQSLEQAGVDRALYLPLLTLVAQGSDSRELLPFPKPIAPRGYVTVEVPTALAQLQLEYSLLNFRRGARYDSGKALEIASTLRLGREQQAIAFATAAEFYKTQQAIGQLAAAKAVLDTAKTLADNAQLQFDNGRATLPDLQNAKAGVEEAVYELATAEGAVKKAKLALTEAIGVEPDAEIAIQEQMEQSTLAGDVKTLIEAALKTRPDLLAHAQDLRRAKDASRGARAAYLPSVDLGASGGQVFAWPTADYGQLGPGSVSTWSVEARLKWDVFNGARRHEVNAALAEQRIASEELRGAQDSVTRQVWDAYVDYQTAEEQDRSSQSFLAAAQTSYDSSLDAYKYGVRSLVDVVQAERQLAKARFAVVRSQAQLLQSVVALSYATGDLLHQPVKPGQQGIQP